MRRVIWSREAQHDLADVHDYYRPIAPDYARRVAIQGVAAGRLLIANPQLGAIVDDGPLRKWRVADTPYLLLYKVAAPDLEIVRLVHGARDWRKLV